MGPLSMFRLFRTRGCPNATKCDRYPCWYAHHEQELRREEDVMTDAVFEMAKKAHSIQFMNGAIAKSGIKCDKIDSPVVLQSLNLLRSGLEHDPKTAQKHLETFSKSEKKRYSQ